jgi:hypothetical protein
MQLSATLTRNGLLFSLLVVALVLLGFWRSYFSNPLVLPHLYLHLHAAGMTLWCVLLVTQVSLIRVNRRALHRLVGWFSLLLVPFNVVLMLAVVRVRVPTFSDAFDDGTLNATGQFIVVANLMAPILFAVLFGYAMVHRRAPAIHARYMLCMPLPVIGPAVDRIITGYLPGVATFWTEIIGSAHLEVLGWLLVDIGLFCFVIWDFVVHRSTNVFGRVLAMFVVLQVFAVYSPRLPIGRILGAWFLGI